MRLGGLENILRVEKVSNIEKGSNNMGQHNYNRGNERQYTGGDSAYKGFKYKGESQKRTKKQQEDKEKWVREFRKAMDETIWGVDEYI